MEDEAPVPLEFQISEVLREVLSHSVSNKKGIRIRSSLN
jgi:hypothetical protein